ncbi:rRNA processing/ribosome biogenesis-domain-containing protein [Cytidiella melzeri]|nr:rRNA processing/ribosome biogenesis-domain-containing protein [Cytidiella melzeri]
MDSNHPLKTLLQLQLASDGSATLHLPSILSSLSHAAFEPSIHLQKWTARINSLIHSKDGGARWAGLCIALRTSTLSRAIMLDCAQSWVTASLSLTAKNESLPVLKACIRLLRYILTAASGIPEFQRQVTTPNVPKFSSALVSIVGKHDDTELQILSLNTLTHLLVNYPTLHRTLQTSLNSTALRFLNGSSPKPVPQALVEASSGLYAVLHYTGGKVGAAAQWRKSPSQPLGDPLIIIPMNIDRLRIAVKVLSDLLRTSNPRPVAVPIGPLVNLCVELLSCSAQGQGEGHTDRTLHTLESSVVPQIQGFGCILLQSLAASAQQALAPHLTNLYYCITLLLEQKLAAFQQLLSLNAACALLTHCPGLTDPQLPSRLLRSILPNLTFLLAPQSEAQKDPAQNGNAHAAKGRKGKKRARAYEGDEVFKIGRDMLCSTKEAGEVVLATLDATQKLLQCASLSPSIQSLTGRILLALFTSLPHIPPGLLSFDLSLHSQLHAKLQQGCITFASGTTSNMSKSLGLVINASVATDSPSSLTIWHDIDLMLHPRVPPLSLSLFQAEEGQEELDTRKEMGVATMAEAVPPLQPITIQDNASQSTKLSPDPPLPAITSTTGNSSTLVINTQPSATAADAAPRAAPLVAVRPESLADASSNLPVAGSTIQEPTIVASHSTPVANPIPAVKPIVLEEDEDEPMPDIDLGSDSDID